VRKPLRAKSVRFSVATLVFTPIIWRSTCYVMSWKLLYARALLTNMPIPKLLCSDPDYRNCLHIMLSSSVRSRSLCGEDHASKFNSSHVFDVSCRCPSFSSFSQTIGCLPPTASNGRYQEICSAVKQCRWRSGRVLKDILTENVILFKLSFSS